MLRRHQPLSGLPRGAAAAAAANDDLAAPGILFGHRGPADEYKSMDVPACEKHARQVNHVPYLGPFSRSLEGGAINPLAANPLRRRFLSSHNCFVGSSSVAGRCQNSNKGRISRGPWCRREVPTETRDLNDVVSAVHTLQYLAGSCFFNHSSLKCLEFLLSLRVAAECFSI